MNKGIGIAIPAVIDKVTNEIVEAPLLGKHSHFNLPKFVQSLTQKYNVPVFIHNDVNASAYGEYRDNYANDTKSMLYLSVGTGVGCGIIMDEKIVEGENGSAGEIGYMIFFMT